MHCTTEYPAPMEEINLRAIKTLKKAFKLNVGYSDHSEGNEVSIGAVAMGATIIEKHLTLDKSMEGPDHKSSLNPKQFKKLVYSIRKIETALGSGIKKATKSEKANLNVARKSLVAVTEINKGDIFSKENIGIKRPGNGIPPKYLPDFLGKPANKCYKPDDLIEF